MLNMRILLLVNNLYRKIEKREKKKSSIQIKQAGIILNTAILLMLLTLSFIDAILYQKGFIY